MNERHLVEALIEQFGDFEKNLFHDMSRMHVDNDKVEAYLLESEKVHRALNQLANRSRMGAAQSGKLFSADNKASDWKMLFTTIDNVLHHIEKETSALEKMYANQKEFTYRSSHFDDFKYKLALRNELVKIKKQLHDKNDAASLTKVKKGTT